MLKTKTLAVAIATDVSCEEEMIWSAAVKNVKIKLTAYSFWFCF